MEKEGAKPPTPKASKPEVAQPAAEEPREGEGNNEEPTAPTRSATTRPTEKGWKATLKRVGKFMWNSQTKQFMGRGGRRWALLGIFYILFFFKLGCFFSGLLAIVLGVLNKDTPEMVYHDQDSWYGKSLIQRYPAVILTPVPNRDINPESPLVWITKETGPAWGKKIQDELEAYDKYISKGNCNNCFTHNINETCKEDSYGYTSGRPAFIVRVSKILGWRPTYFQNRDMAVKYIEESIKSKVALKQFQELEEDHFKNSVLILCQGETEWDDQILGKAQYCTPEYINGSYFPFENTKRYLPPFVMIRFPAVLPGIPVTVQCYPILDNLKVDEKKAWSMETFEFMVQ